MTAPLSLLPLVIPYPEIDPVLIHLGPFAIRWYALAYIAGLVIGWRVMRRVCEQPPKILSPEKIDDFLLWAALGVILGGRIGYVLFYKPSFFLANPLQIFTLWEGGMSFHGGLLGVIVAIIAYALRNNTSPFMLSDLVAIVTPVGLFFGRIANFINGELWGRPVESNVPWAMVFPQAPTLDPRHPSQLYQAFGEGVVLFGLLWLYARKPRLTGQISGAFLFLYGLQRFVIEFFREPDAYLGLQALGLSRGQWLCLPMILAGLGLWAWAGRRSSKT